MRVPREIVIDYRKRKVLIDGLPFIYPLAEDIPRPQFGADDMGVVWLPLLCDKVTYRADFELGGVTYGSETQPASEQRAPAQHADSPAPGRRP